jgi:gas vesicle protein
MTINTFKAYLTGFTLGGLLATTITLLYAPRTGEQTRTLLSSRKDEAQEKTRQFLAEAQQRASQVLTRKTTDALDEAEALLNHGQEYLEATRQKVEDEELIA